MSVSFENKETNRGVLTFTISQDQIKPELDRVFNSVKKSLNVPGFRKGHLPRPIFDQKFGEESLYQDVMNALLPNAYEAAVKEAGLEVVAQPKIDVTSMEKGQELAIEQEVSKKVEYNRNHIELHEDLTARERDVLQLIAKGYENQRIADELFISLKTVKTHVSNILAKLQVSDRTQAAVYAFQHHLVGHEDF